jgi:hypothetical protein
LARAFRALGSRHRVVTPLVIRTRSHWFRGVAALLGLVVLVGGVVALFTIENSAGSLFLITVGIVLLLVVFLGGRIQLESFELLGAKIKVRDVVKSRLQLAQLADAGQQDSERDVRGQALTLQKLVALYDLYEYVRRTQRFSSRRTAALDELAVRMQVAGGETQFDPADVSTWFHEGDDPLRVVALNLMLAREECRDFLAVLKTIDEPRSNFEQYYGLRLGQRMLDGLDWLERQLLADAIARAQRARRFRRDDDLMSLSNAILAELDDRTAGAGGQENSQKRTGGVR